LSVGDDTPATDIGQIADEVAARETTRLPVHVEADVRRILRRAAHRLAAEAAAEYTKGKAA